MKFKPATVFACLSLAHISAAQDLSFELPEGVSVDAVLPASDGGFFVDWPLLLNDRITKYGADLQEQWSFELSTSTPGRSVQKMHVVPQADGGAVLVGYGGAEIWQNNHLSDSSRAMISLVRLNGDGQLVLARSFGVLYAGMPGSLEPWADPYRSTAVDDLGNLFMLVQEPLYGGYSVVKFNADLSPEWMRDGLAPYGRVTPDGSGGAFLPMTVQAPEHLQVLHLGSDGSMIWCRQYTHNDAAYYGGAEVQVNNDGGLLIGGSVMNDGFLLRTDENGQPLSYTLYAPVPGVPPGNTFQVSSFKRLADDLMVMKGGISGPDGLQTLQFLNTNGDQIGVYVAPHFAEGPWEECGLEHGPLVANGTEVFAPANLYKKDLDFNFREDHFTVRRVLLANMDGCNYQPGSFNTMDYPIAQLEVSNGPAPVTVTNYDIRELLVEEQPFDAPDPFVACTTTSVTEHTGPTVLQLATNLLVQPATINITVPEAGTVRGYDPLGKLVLEQQVNAGTHGLPLMGLSPGVYTLVLGSAGQQSLSVARFVLEQ